MTQRVHPARRARDIALGMSVAAVVSIAGFLGLSSHTATAASTNASTATTVGSVSQRDDYYYGGAQPGVVSNSANTASRGS
jgi:hypothetical protein